MPVSTDQKQIKSAVKRLEQNLPLRSNQLSLPEDLRRLHQSILWFYFKNCRAPLAADMQHVGNRADAIAHLAKQQIVLVDGSGTITGAYPFVNRARGFCVTSCHGAVQAMCAFDALAVSNMFAMPTQIESVCRCSGDKIRIRQGGESLEVIAPDKKVYAAIDWNARDTSLSCAESLCTEMMFIAGEDEALNWKVESQTDRELFDLNTATEMIGRIFLPLMH